MKRASGIACVALVFVVGLGLLKASPKDDPKAKNDPKADQDSDSRIRRGLEVAPVPLNFAGLNPALVALGSYIVNAQGGCNDCHTNPSYVVGGDPFLGEPEVINSAGYLAGGRPFGPTITSRNLTPRLDTGLPAGLTLQQFKRVMHLGARSSTARLLQVMPWPVYGKMTDRDLEAVYEFLSAIPSLPNPPSPSAP